jgi:hypothetical protein
MEKIGQKMGHAAAGNRSEKLAPEMEEIGRKMGARRCCKSAGKAGGKMEEIGQKSWARHCWGIAGNGEGDFRERENVEGENVGENVFWPCEYWLTRVALKFGGKISCHAGKRRTWDGQKSHV